MKLIIAGIIFLLLCVIYRQQSDIIEAEVQIDAWKQVYISDSKKSDEKFLQLFDECWKSQQSCIKPETPL